MADAETAFDRAYERSALRPRILHIGFGAFARAHTLVYCDEALHRGGGDWGVVAARLHSGADDLTGLDGAGGLYSVAEMDGDSLSVRTVGAVIGSVHPKRDGARAVVERIAHPDLRIVSLTITEKGYCLAGGGLDLGNPGIRHDLAEPDNPETAIGFIVEGLRKRRAENGAGLTILSCDNLPNNGASCKAAILGFAKERAPGLADWILDMCRFPSTMVDRITPAMDETAHEKLTAVIGREDPSGILCEAFRQWVIEDDFANGRPDWDLAGADFVADVTPFEDMKLRMLNGSHSFLAYLGALAGKATVAECMADGLFVRASRRLMLKEQAPTLNMPAGVDLEAYAARLLDRFANTALHHRTTQIASDGSQKLPQRLLAPIEANMASGNDWPLSALAVAGWMAYCRGHADDGASLPPERSPCGGHHGTCGRA
jgi:fructuronate reductase